MIFAISGFIQYNRTTSNKMIPQTHKTWNSLKVSLWKRFTTPSFPLPETINFQPSKFQVVRLMVQKSGDHQLRLVVYSVIYRVFIHPRWWSPDFFHQLRMLVLGMRYAFNCPWEPWHISNGLRRGIFLQCTSQGWSSQQEATSTRKN